MVRTTTYRNSPVASTPPVSGSPQGGPPTPPPTSAPLLSLASTPLHSPLRRPPAPTPLHSSLRLPPGPLLHIHLRRPPAPCPPAHPSEACGLHCPLSTHRPGGHTIVHVALPGSYPFRTENKQSQREAHNAPAGHREKRHPCPLLSMVLRWTCHPGPQLRGRSVQRVLQCPPAA